MARDIGKTIARTTTSLKQRWLALIGIYACATSLMGAATLLRGSAALAGPPGDPAAALTNAKATIDAKTTQVQTLVNQEAAALTTFVDSATLADKSATGVESQAKATLNTAVAQLLNVGEQAIPDNPSDLQLTFNPQAPNACKQVDGTDVFAQGTAVCTTNGDGDKQAVAQAEGDGASSTAYAIHAGLATAQTQGDGSAATATAGAATRTGEASNVANALSTNGSTTTATAGVGDYDEKDQATAIADGGSLATADSEGGDSNQQFAGSFNHGEAHANNRSGDNNVAIALGANNSNDGAGPSGALATTLIGNNNTALSVADGLNSTATTNAGYGDSHQAAANAGPNSQARADSAQGEKSQSFATATDRGHALSFNSYGDDMLAISISKGDGSTGRCNPIGQPVNSGETTYPPDACSTANARAVDGQSNTAISIVDKAKAYSVAERGTHNIAVTNAVNGGDIIWNTTKVCSVTTTRSCTVDANCPAGQTCTGNPHGGLTADCPYPLPPLPQAQQACGNATAKASYGDGNLAVAAPNGDHSFAWSESSGGGYNQTYTTTDGANCQARARGIYNNFGLAKAMATNGGHADSAAILGYANVAVAKAVGTGSVANATAAGPHAQATAAASSGGTATAVHNTTTIAAFITGPLVTGVTCSNAAVTYAMIGTGASCGTGF